MWAAEPRKDLRSPDSHPMLCPCLVQRQSSYLHCVRAWQCAVRQPRFPYSGSGAFALLRPFLGMTVLPHFLPLCPAPSFRGHSGATASRKPSIALHHRSASWIRNAHTCPSFLLSQCLNRILTHYVTVSPLVQISPGDPCETALSISASHQLAQCPAHSNRSVNFVDKKTGQLM